MPLLRDLWSTSPRRSAVVVALVLLGAVGMAVAAAVGRRGAGRPVRCAVRGARRRAGRRRASATSRRPDHGRADRRLGGRRTPRGCAGSPSARTCRRWRTRRSASCSTASTATSTRSASELRGSGVRIAQSLAVALGRRSSPRFVVWWPAGLGMLLLAAVLVVGLRRPTAAHRPGPDARGGGLVRPGRGDGGVHPRPGRRPDQPGPAVRAAPLRAARQRGAPARPPGVDDVGPGHRVGGRGQCGSASRSRSSAAPGR